MSGEMKYSRLSDRILCALDLAIEQEDIAIAEQLITSLEQSLTRSAGGGDFVERRNYPEELTTIKIRLDEIKRSSLRA